MRKKQLKRAAGVPRPRQGRGRQRQRLIDACISALHIYGPSRTTVEKVVAIAKMSPGIVRFYFDSKAAMLVASLQFLAAEFEERVLVPVAKLKSTPVAALESLVDLYLDADIASPRKVSVWYAFWGEASSRQEYYDICGQKDERFAALVRELIETLIRDTVQPHLDADGVALGLIGALEILWQDLAFQAERDIDRIEAKERCMAYLRSIFPGRFPGSSGRLPQTTAATVSPVRIAAWAYGDANIQAVEREQLFRRAWTVAGHESQIPHAGDFLTVDTGAERALLVRDSSGTVHALRNSCPESPHMLAARRSGRFAAGIECKVHGLRFSLDGRRQGAAGRADLSALELSAVEGLMFVRSANRRQSEAVLGGAEVGSNEAPPLDAEPPSGLTSLSPPTAMSVAADWKVVVEQWLESAQPVASAAAQDFLAWHTALNDSTWSGGHYRRLVECVPPVAWHRQFIMPNQLLETRPDGLSVMQAVPTSPGRCVVHRSDYTVLPPDESARAAVYLARRLGPYARRTMLEVAESIQQGIIEFGYGGGLVGTGSPAVAWFRRRLAMRVPAYNRATRITEGGIV